MTHPCQRVGDRHILLLPLKLCVREGKERKKRADLEGSAEDAEFNKRHGVERRGIGGWQLGSSYYVHSTPPTADAKIPVDVIEMGLIRYTLSLLIPFSSYSFSIKTRERS
jgi:hypothetical protein